MYILREIIGCLKSIKIDCDKDMNETSNRYFGNDNFSVYFILIYKSFGVKYLRNIH